MSTRPDAWQRENGNILIFHPILPVRGSEAVPCWDEYDFTGQCVARHQYGRPDDAVALVRETTGESRPARGKVLVEGTPPHSCSPQDNVDSAPGTVWQCDCGHVWSYERECISLIEVILDQGSGRYCWQQWSRLRSRSFLRSLAKRPSARGGSR